MSLLHCIHWSESLLKSQWINQHQIKMLKAHLREQNCFQTNRIMNKQYLSTQKLACESDHERKQNFCLVARAKPFIWALHHSMTVIPPPPPPHTHTRSQSPLSLASAGSASTRCRTTLGVVGAPLQQRSLQSPPPRLIGCMLVFNILEGGPCTALSEPISDCNCKLYKSIAGWGHVVLAVTMCQWSVQMRVCSSHQGEQCTVIHVILLRTVRRFSGPWLSLAFIFKPESELVAYVVLSMPHAVEW